LSTFLNNYCHGRLFRNGKFSIEEVENAKRYIPLYSNKFVEPMQRKEGRGSKLVAKIHLLHNFVDNIINLECANNDFGGIGEHNLKPNVKDSSTRIRYQDDQEYNIPFKQYGKNLSHAGEIELDIRSTLDETAMSEDKYEELHRLGNCFKFTVVDGEVTIKSNEVWKGCVSKDTITSFLSSFGDVEGFL